MFVRIRDSKRKRKNIVRIGGEVNIKSMPGRTPLSRVDPSVPPVIASIPQDRGRKNVVVEYKDSTDGEVHVVELPPKSLRAQSEDVLNIGDRVTLVKRGNGVCPSIGSGGTILGGSGPYTVTFDMELDPDTGGKLDEVVTITQSHIPRNMLKFEGDAPEDGGDNESSGDEEDSGESDDYDVDVGGQNDYYSKSVVLTTLKSKLSPSVYENVIMVLNLEELEELADSLNEDERVDTSNLNSVLALL
jgi:hypothetical protein